jgi:ubiquitin carboxyl-terminal hydrolase 5/13
MRRLGDAKRDDRLEGLSDCLIASLIALFTVPKVKALADSVMQSMSSARQSEVKAWEEEITPCEHTLTLQQSASGPILASGKYNTDLENDSEKLCDRVGLAHCNKCDLKENLWLCLTCGNLGCGRSQAGGAKGNSHGLAHFKESMHPVSVKTGTITAEGTAG